MNTQKKQLIIAVISVLIFCAVTVTGLLLLPIFSADATSVGSEDFEYPEYSAPSNVVAPKRVDNLVYNGKQQALIEKGQDDITYSLEHDGEFTSAIPTAMNAGNYCVFYKVADDDTIYNLHNTIDKCERTVTCKMEGWYYKTSGNEPEIDLPIRDGVTEQITYYKRDGKMLYSKPTEVGQYTVKVFVPESANYAECTASADFRITNRITVNFDASFNAYKNVEINLGTQTMVLGVNPQHGTIFDNSLTGPQILTVTANGEVLFSEEIEKIEIDRTITATVKR